MSSTSETGHSKNVSNFENSEETEEVISILGKENIEKLYRYIGSKKISAAKLHKFIQDEQICQDLKSQKISFTDLAKKYNVSLMT